MKNKKSIPFYTSGIFISGVLVCTTFISILSLIKISMIPNRYLVGLVLGLIIIDLILISTLKIKKIRNLAKIVILVFCLGIVYLTSQINRGSRFVSAITGASKDVYNVVFIVNEDSKIKSVNELSIHKVGANVEYDGYSLDIALPLIESMFDYVPNVIDYSQFDVMGEDLLNGEIDVILTQESNIQIFEELIKDFKSKVRILDMVS